MEVHKTVKFHGTESSLGYVHEFFSKIVFIEMESTNVIFLNVNVSREVQNYQ